MAQIREVPYAQFNFLVQIDDVNDATTVTGGFSEVGGFNVEVDVTEYRTGNAPSNNPQKITGLTRVGDITLRRGMIGSLALWEWFKAASTGEVNSARTVTISLRNEDRSETVMTWVLENARPVKHRSGPLVAAGRDVAVEELVLSCERIDLQ